MISIHWDISKLNIQDFLNTNIDRIFKYTFNMILLGEYLILAYHKYWDILKRILSFSISWTLRYYIKNIDINMSQTLRYYYIKWLEYSCENRERVE